MNTLKKLIKAAIEATQGNLTMLLFLLVTLIALWSSPGRAQGVMGTYVVPRVFTLYSGEITNGQTVNLNALTNLLNYSGYHNIGIWGSTLATSNNVNIGSNVTVSLNFSPGPGGGYTNSVIGTNLMFTTYYPWSWTFTNNGTTAYATYTNLNAQIADSVLQINGKVVSQATNIWIQIDGVLTP